MADTGIQPMTSGKSLQSLSSTVEDTDPNMIRETPPYDWLAPLPTTKDTRRRRYNDVSQYSKYHLWGLSTADGDEECIAPPRRIPLWILPPEETQGLIQAGHGTATDLIYARGVSNSPSQDSTSFDKKHCTLILVEIDLCIDLEWDIKI
jgi:hypothetical protein